MSLSTPLLAAFLAGGSPLFQDDWRAFRGTDGRATSARAVPVTWSDVEGVAWALELPGPGSSSPIVVGESVFVTCWSGYAPREGELGDPADLRRHLLRVDRESGELLWSVDVEPVASEDEFGGRMATHGYASSTPTSDGERVYAFFGKSGVRAYDLEGEELWRADVGASSSPWKTGSGSSPTLWGGLVLVNASDEGHKLCAFQALTGELVWERTDPGLDQCYGTLAVVDEGDRGVLLVALLGSIWGLDPRTGETRWSVTTTTDGALAPSVVVHGDVLYSFGGQTQMRSHAVRLGGVGDVTETHVLWARREGCYVATPLYSDGHLYWVDRGGIAHCMNAETGELVYKERLEGEFYASVVRAGERIYATSRENGVYVLPAEPRFQVLAHNRLEDDTIFDGTPAPSRGELFLRSRRALYCIRE